MILKKSLKRGQAILEYFIIFASIGALGIVSISFLFPRARNAIQGTDAGTGFFQKAAQGILDADSKY